MCTLKELPFPEADPDNPTQVEVGGDHVHLDTTSVYLTPLWSNITLSTNFTSFTSYPSEY